MDSSPRLQSKIPGTCPRLEWLAILEPHDSSLKDNAVKAVGLVKFAEHYWSLFARIQLIRKKKVAGGVERYFCLDVGNGAVRKKVLAVTTNNQLDQVFDTEAMPGFNDHQYGATP